MKIGKFATHHGVTQDTVRYYMERGLIVAQKRGEQFAFTEEDDRDMKLILEWKRLGFPLTSILSLLTIQRLSGEHSDSFRNQYRLSLEHKQSELSQAMVELEVLSCSIAEQINDQKKADEMEKPVLGLPLTSLDILVCPQCSEPIQLSNGSFQNHMIMEANVNCICGYAATIHQGVFIDEASLRPKLMNDGPMPTKEEYIKSTSHTYINYVYQTMAAIAKYLEACQKEPDYILEISNCSGLILMQYIKALSKNTVFILVDHDLDRLMRLKRNLERFHDHKRFIFLATDYSRLPLANDKIDAMADFGMTSKLYMENGRDLPAMMSDLLKADGIYIASSLYFGENSKRRGEVVDPEGIFTKQWQINQLEKGNLKITQEALIGPVFQEGLSELDHTDMELYQLVVCSRKIKKS